MRRYRFLLGPKWIAFHLLVLVAVVTMVNLAFWQIRRLHEREAFNTLVRDNADQPVTPLADVLGPTTALGSVEWRRVSVTGTYLTGAELEVVNRSQDGEAGSNLVDALRLHDGSLILVNRGFAPSISTAAAAPRGTVELVGQLRVSEVRRLGQPSDARGVKLTEIRRIDIDKLAPQFDAPLAPMYLQLLESTPPVPGQYPAPVAQPVLDNGPHLNYTFQWFAFSLCAVVGWVLAVRRSAATRSGERPKRRRGPPPIDDDLARV